MLKDKVKKIAFLLLLLRNKNCLLLKYSNKGQIDKAIIAPQIMPDKKDLKIKKDKKIKNKEKYRYTLLIWLFIKNP